MTLSIRTAWFLAILFVMIGCNSGPKVVPVKGIATRNGKPVKNLFLKFYPPDGRSSWGYTDDEGRFELEYTREQKGAITASHQVTAENKPKGPNFDGKFQPHPDQAAIHEKYGKRDTTRMTVEITEATEKLELKFD